MNLTIGISFYLTLFLKLQVKLYSLYKKETHYEPLLKWGGRWDSNPRISEPQSEVLTA